MSRRRSSWMTIHRLRAGCMGEHWPDDDDLGPDGPQRHGEVRGVRRSPAEAAAVSSSFGEERFDGLFFSGIVTTGVYCRSVCPVPPARRENVRFFTSVTAAEGAGFRPCL